MKKQDDGHLSDYKVPRPCHCRGSQNHHVCVWQCVKGIFPHIRGPDHQSQIRFCPVCSRHTVPLYQDDNCKAESWVTYCKYFSNVSENYTEILGVKILIQCQLWQWWWFCHLHQWQASTWLVTSEVTADEQNWVYTEIIQAHVEVSTGNFHSR